MHSPTESVPLSQCEIAVRFGPGARTGNAQCVVRPGDDDRDVFEVRTRVFGPIPVVVKGRKSAQTDASEPAIHTSCSGVSGIKRSSPELLQISV